MNSILTAALREATRLTQTRKLADATRLIQETLGGGQYHVTPTSQEDGSSTTPPRLQSPQTEAPFRRPPSPGPQKARLKRPLGETIHWLRQGRLGGLDPLVNRPNERPPIRDGAEFLTRSFSGPAGTLTYELYLPRRRNGVRGLLVMLHGCTQDPLDFAIGTDMNEIAEENDLIVVYPAQRRAANASLCWNWFDLKDQKRGSGEPATIAALTKKLMAEFAIESGRVFVAGLSAGGAMAAILGATYPDIYSSIGIHSGLPSGAAGDLMSGLAAMRGEGQWKAPTKAQSSLRPGQAPVRTIVFHGDADQTVHPSNGDDIVAAAKSEWGQKQEEIVTARSPDGSPYRRMIVRNADGLPVLEHWIVHGMGHAWSGGSSAGSYTDPRGPDASREMVRFFLE